MLWDALGTVRELAAGELLWQEGDQAGEVALLLAGELEVLQESPQGDVAVVNTLAPGEILGEMSCLDGSAHSATVRARGPSRVRRVGSAEFRAWLQAHPHQWAELFARQSARLRALTRQMAHLGFDPVKSRVARLLGQLASPGVPLTITHQELAERVATTRESVSKALGALAREGLVHLARGRITVVDPQGLQSLGQ